MRIHYFCRLVNEMLQTQSVYYSFDSQTANNSYFIIIYPVEMTYRHHVTLDGHFVALDLMDTAGKVSKTMY